MNTLGDTDKRRPRPAVWPVYVAAGIIGAVSLLVLRIVLVVPWGSRVYFPGLIILYPWTMYILFGLVAAWGLLRLRLWGWWCAVVWTIVFAAAIGFGELFREALLATTGLIQFQHIAIMSRLTLGLWVAVMALLVWPLATRRRLFFLPKPEGEE